MLSLLTFVMDTVIEAIGVVTLEAVVIVAAIIVIVVVVIAVNPNKFKID